MITKVPVTDPFTLAGDCPDKSHPFCLNFVFDASNTASGSGISCEVGVQWNSSSTVTNDASVGLIGQLTCPSGAVSGCAQAKAVIEAAQQVIPVTPPPPTSSSSSETSPSGESPSGADTSGSEQSSTPDTSSPES
jgi:hypothetical protein